MTYNELKSRLQEVETALKQLKSKKNKNHTPAYIKETTSKLTIIKESLSNKLSLLKEREATVRTADSKEAEKLAKKGIPVDLVDKIEEVENSNVEFTANEMSKMIVQVGKALGQALVNLGDELARIKAHRIETNSFDIHVVYKGERAGTDDEFAFHVEDGNLHLADFSFNKKLVDIGVKPSGEPFINVDVLKNELTKHFKSLSEEKFMRKGGRKVYLDADGEEIVDEDLDVGHQDNEPSMVKKQLYKIMKDAENLYNAVSKYEGGGEVDFPSWWQSKITKSQTYLSGAHDYLDSAENVDEAMDTPMPDTTNMSVGDLQKVYSLIVDKMLELNDLRKEKGLDHMYMGGTEPGKHSVRDHLISLTRKKKQVASAIDDKVAGIGKAQELDEGDLAYIKDKDYETIKNLLKFIDDHADDYSVNPEMEPAVGFLKRIMRETKGAPKGHYFTKSGNLVKGRLTKAAREKGARLSDPLDKRRSKVPPVTQYKNEDYDVNEMLRHSVIAKHDGYELVKKSNTPQLTIAKKGKSVGNFRTSGNEKEDIEQFQKMVKSGKINEGTDLYDGDKFSMKRFAGPNGIALQITARKLKGGGFEYIQIDGDDVKEFARAAVHVAQEFYDIDRQVPVNEEEDVQKRLEAEKAIRQTLKDEGGAAGLEPLVKAVKQFGFNKEELIKLLKKVVKVDKHKHGDYILTPINEEEKTYKGKDYKVTLEKGRKYTLKGVHQATYKENPSLSKDRAHQVAKQIHRSLSEGEGDDHHYIKVPRRQYKKAQSVIDDVLRNDVYGGHKHDIVDNDGAGNVIFYFMGPEEKAITYDAVVYLRNSDVDVVDSSVSDIDESTLKEYTDNSFTGAEIIDKVSKNSPDMFGKQLFSDILPMGVASEDDAVKALQAHDKSPIKARMGQYAPMFVHMQYHEFIFDGVEYQLHQQQYYNNNFAEKDPTFNPRVTVLTLFKDPKGEDELLGKIVAKTEEYIKDLNNLKITKKAS